MIEISKETLKPSKLQEKNVVLNPKDFRERSAAGFANFIGVSKPFSSLKCFSLKFTK